MSSWIRCKCDCLLHKNLFCGTGMSLVATEEFLDRTRTNASADDLVSELVHEAVRLLACKNCGRIVLLTESKENHDIRFFKPDN
jgi:hypothetical protein